MENKAGQAGADPWELRRFLMLFPASGLGHIRCRFLGGQHLEKRAGGWITFPPLCFPGMVARKPPGDVGISKRKWDSWNFGGHSELQTSEDQPRAWRRRDPTGKSLESEGGGGENMTHVLALQGPALPLPALGHLLSLQLLENTEEFEKCMQSSVTSFSRAPRQGLI